LLAYKATFVAIKALLLMHDISEDVDATLDSARNSESVQNPVKEKYGKGLETLLRAVDQASFDQALSEFLRSWRPKGAPN
jgi:hypothetical protein